MTWQAPRVVALSTFAIVAALGTALLVQAGKRAAVERQLATTLALESAASGLEAEFAEVFAQLESLRGKAPRPAGPRTEIVMASAGGKVRATTAARAVLEAADVAILEGPLPAVHAPLRARDGTRKAVARLPLDPADGAGASLMAVLDLDALLAAHLSPRLEEYRYRLAAGGSRAAILARSAADVPMDAMRREVRAGAERWELAAAPARGWAGHAHGALHMVIVLAAALGAALLAYDAARERTVLRDVVARRGASLREANRKLVEEVEQREALEKRFSHASFHDAATALPNRRMLLRRLEQALAATRGAGGGLVGFAVLSFDRGKSLGDRLGASAADEVMSQAGRRFEARLRDAATVGRAGDAAFGLVFTCATREAAIAALDDVLRTLAEPFVVADQRLFVAGHAGIAFSADGYDHPADLDRGAHIALGTAEKLRVPQATFDPSAQEQVASRHQIETDLHGVAARGELRLAFQPVVSLADGAVRGLEALVRWQHPVEGLVPPGRFIPIAEETGLITPITLWVLREACRNAAAWRREGHDDFYVSVNLSAHDMRDAAIADRVAEALAAASLPASALRLEVTESAMIDNLAGAAAVMERLRAMGVRILLDDFGTGYSSLAYLHRFRIDYLKVDQSFVRRMTPDPKSSGVVRAILLLAEGMEIQAIAEGIEDAATAQLLRELRCPYGQGYHYSRPVDPEAAGKLLAGGRLG